jgi:RNA recognition motif-containing protein
MNIYVGNLPFRTSEDDLRQAFEAFGAVSSASIITDRETGRSRGFGFVEMPNGEEAQKAIESLNGSKFSGRDLTVNEARPRGARTDGPGH